MGLLQAVIDALTGKKNVTPVVICAVVDDGSADPIAVGKLSPLRADPTTGIVKQGLVASNYTLTQTVIALSTTGADLGDTVSTSAPGGWELFCENNWYVGDENGQARLVAANEPWYPPGSTLVGVYAKSALGTPNLIATGGVSQS
jgi:hypothetical protein